MPDDIPKVRWVGIQGLLLAPNRGKDRLEKLEAHESEIAQLLVSRPLERSAPTLRLEVAVSGWKVRLFIRWRDSWLPNSRRCYRRQATDALRCDNDKDKDSNE